MTVESLQKAQEASLLKIKKSRQEIQLKKLLEKYGYKLVRITRFKNCDRVRLEAVYGFITVNYRKHVEDYTVKELCDGLLDRDSFIKEFGCDKGETE